MGAGAGGASGGKTKAAGLTIANATYGRSKAGRDKLKNDFYGDINNLISVLNGDKYRDFKRIVSQNWVGADATDFLNDVEKTRKSLESKLKALKKQFDNAIDGDAKQFSSFQSKNIK